MDSAIIALRLREKIAQFSGILSKGLPKVAQRFVGEMIYGIQARESVRLTEIARALEERISLKKTQERLCRQLKRPTLGKRLQDRLLEMASEHITEDALLVLDIGDVSKKYARKMEYLDRVRDGSEGEITNGYWLCSVIGAGTRSNKVIPLYNKLYSCRASEFMSENTEIMNAVTKVSEKVQGRGIWVIDRGGDRRVLFDFFLEGKKRFIIRLKGDRHLVWKGKEVEALELACGTDTLYSEYIVEEKEKKEEVKEISFGYKKVKLPGSDEGLYLLVTVGFGEKPLMLLTTEPLRRNRKVLLKVLKNYIRRWEIEKTFRFIKQSYQVEDVRVLGYKRLQNLMMIVMAVAYFAMAVMDERSKLKVMVGHIYKIAKRVFGVPDFRYYAIADGIMALFARHPGSIRHCQGKVGLDQLTLGLCPGG